MLVVSHFTVADSGAADFAERARELLAVLATRPGHLSGRVARAVDDPAEWVLVTEWDGVGAYRRALSAFEVRVLAAPLFAESRDEPSAYEVLHAVDSDGQVTSSTSDRRPDLERGRR